MDGIKYNDKLWFEHKGCEGKHFLIGNPHTHYGRMLAWCPKKKTTFCVSKSEIGKMSDQANNWIQGFLSGNQPYPPTDAEGEVHFESKEYKKWVEGIELFLESGYWWEGEGRICEKCGEELLPSEPEEVCGICQNKK